MGMDNLIRATIKHCIEGDDVHDLAVYLAERMLKKRGVDLWTPEKRNDFRMRGEYPGLPDIVYTVKEKHGVYTYVVEVETRLTPKAMIEKIRQFKIPGITDVLFVNLRQVKDDKNWIEIEKVIRERLA